MAATIEVNPPGRSVDLTRELVWRGLVMKAENALPFVPAMQECTVIERFENGLVRSILARGERLTERVTFTPDIAVLFERTDPAGTNVGWIVNLLSESEHGLLPRRQSRDRHRRRERTRRTYARAHAAKGAALVFCDIADATALAAELTGGGAEALAVVCDVADAVRATEARFGAVHILINNAALMGPAAKALDAITTGEWDGLMAVNVRGPFEFVKAVLPIMRRQQYGKIVNISSGMFFKGSPFLLHYVVSKGAIIAMTRSMARELGPDNITVNCVAPGLVLTEGAKRVSGSIAQIAIDTRSLKREQTPEDLVGSIVFFSSPDSIFVTGQTVIVDGGSVMSGSVMN